VLVFTKGISAEHVSGTAAAVRAIGTIAERNGFRATVTDQASAFTESNLERYRAVIFLNTAGDVLDDAQQAAFERYYTDGGGLLAVHAAIDAEPSWQFMTDVLGARATGESALAAATVKVADRVHAASEVLPEYWKRSDAWLNFDRNVRGVSHVLATVDESTYAGGTMGPDHPVAWCKDYRGGRSFYTAGGHAAASFESRSFRRHLAGAITWTAGLADPDYSDCGATVLANYQQVKVSAPPNLDEPIGIDVLPHGRVIQTTRGGRVRLHDPSTGNVTVLATIPVYTNSEDGLYGPAIDNDFARNRWVYLYYAPVNMEPPYPPTTPSGSAPTTAADASAWDPWRGYFQLSRFKFVDATATTPARLDLASEQKILKVENDRGACCHVAGDIDFDRHNNLWLVTGDDTPSGGGNSGGFAPFNDTLTADGLFNAPFVDARRSALNTNDLRGKLLRIKVDADGGYSIPRGNLFDERKDTAGKTRPEIYAMGFRNPFRVQVDSDGVAYLTDYSPDAQVPQQFRGPAGTGRVEIVRKPGNYGWPLCMSPTLPFYRWNFNAGTPLDTPPQPFECDNPKRGPENTSGWNTGLTQTPPVVQPDLWYSYRDNANPPLGTPCLAYYDGSGGSCPQLFPELFTGGVGPHGAAKYEYDRRDPSTTKLPPYYDGAVFLGEFTQDTLREVRLDSRNRVFKINSLLDCGQAPSSRFPFECDNPMDMQFGPDGAFYLLTYGDGFFSANRDAGIYRWEYVKGQRAPLAVLSATPTDGIAPLTVQFSSEGSRDPDPGDSITFAWDFDNNGTVDSIDPSPSHVYTANGVYTAKLTVTDSTGKTDIKTTVITVGNSSPKVTVTTPIDGDFFAWGDTIPFTVNVTDAEDAAIDCNRVEVTFVLVHDTHGHAEENVRGCSGVLRTLAEDASHGGYIAGGISASYTDTGANGQPALTTTAQNVVQLRRQEVEFVQEHQGTDVAGGFIPLPDGDFRTNLDPGDWMALNNRYRVSNATRFTARVNACGTTAGAPAGTLEARLGAPDGELLATLPVTVNDTFQFCEFVPTFTDVSAPITAPAGSHRVYLVARAASGGPTTSMFKVTSVEFGS